METTIIAVLLIVLFVITWIVIACNAPTDISVPNLSIKPNFWEVDRLEIENAKLRNDIGYLRSENEYMKKMHMPSCCMYGHNCPCGTRVYMPSISEQKLADIITKGQKSAEQLAKDLKL